ncbi:MAG: ligand-binding SRPBCC domain-containing protein [Maribacter sp.]|jgi:ligand-binding SRPBCC domain-containing protein
MPIITIETIINADKQIVFDLSRSIDLHKISTEETNEEAIAGVTSGLIGMNESVTWRAKHLSFYQNLTSKITAFDSPHLFTDEMTKGIFKCFKHQHIFTDLSNGTKMIDIFDYTSPLGFLGKIVDNLFLEKYMINLLIKRNEVLKHFAESGRWKEVL